MDGNVFFSFEICSNQYLFKILPNNGGSLLIIVTLNNLVDFEYFPNIWTDVWIWMYLDDIYDHKRGNISKYF